MRVTYTNRSPPHPLLDTICHLLVLVADPIWDNLKYQLSLLFVLYSYLSVSTTVHLYKCVKMIAVF